jgi:hypothetical protein
MVEHAPEMAHIVRPVSSRPRVCSTSCLGARTATP